MIRLVSPSVVSETEERPRENIEGQWRKTWRWEQR